jgi:hypothetical protein
MGEARTGLCPFKPLVTGSNPVALIFIRKTCSRQVFLLKGEAMAAIWLKGLGN